MMFTVLEGAVDLMSMLLAENPLSQPLVAKPEQAAQERPSAQAAANSPLGAAEQGTPLLFRHKMHLPPGLGQAASLVSCKQQPCPCFQPSTDLIAGNAGPLRPQQQPLAC